MKNILESEKYTSIDGYLIRNTLVNNSKDKVWNKNSFLERSEKKYSTTNVETEIVKNIIYIYTSKYKIGKESLIVDIGAADGRIEKILQNRDYKNIIAIDLDEDNIANISNKFENNVKCIVDDATQINFENESIDCLILWGVISCIPQNYVDVLNRFETFLKKDGIIILAEPTIEQALIYSLVMNELDEFKNILKTSSRAAYWENKDIRYKLYKEQEIDEFIGNSKFEILDTDQIGMLGSLIFGGLLQKEEFKHMTEVEKEECFNEILEINNDISLIRQKVYILGRKDG